jgi:hypothetical protein
MVRTFQEWIEFSRTNPAMPGEDHFVWDMLADWAVEHTILVARLKASGIPYEVIFPLAVQEPSPMNQWCGGPGLCKLCAMATWEGGAY